MKTRFLFSLLFLHASLALWAQASDDNIIITNQEETYTFEVDKTGVSIRKVSKTDYECMRMTASLPVYEMYDYMSSVDKVKISGVSGVKPSYSQYMSDGIFYNDAKLCYFLLPFDRKGTKISVTLEKTYKDPRYFDPVFISEPVFVRQKTVKFIVPEEMKIDFVRRHFGSNITEKIEDYKGGKIHVFTASDQKAMKREARMPGISHVYPYIMTWIKSAALPTGKQVYFEGMDDLYNWYREIVGQVNNDIEAVSALAKQITEGCNTDVEKVKALFGWVQKNIRYIAFEDGIAGFKPDNAQQVIQKKYGDCKGMANLLTSLLVAEKFDARLTWTGTDHIAYGYEVPALYDDNHMICTLFFNGKTYFLDATADYLPFGVWPCSIQGQEAIIADGEKYIRQRVPVLPVSSSTDSLHCVYTLEGDSMRVRGVNTFTGECKQRLLSLVDTTPIDKLPAALRDFVAQGNSAVHAKETTLQGATPQSDALILNFEIKTAGKVQKFDDEYYVGMDHFRDWENLEIDTKKRENDYKHMARLRMVACTTLEVKDGYRVKSVPEDLRIQRDTYSMAISYKNLGNKVLYEKVLELDGKVIRRDRMEEWNKDINQLKKAYLEQVVLTKH